MDARLVADAALAREALLAGGLRGAALRARLNAVPLFDRDPWVDALLGLPEPPPDEPKLPFGAVPYLPAGVEEILAVVDEVPLTPNDRLVDLGAGLGRVAMLGHLLSGARAHGVELQGTLVALAEKARAELGLTEVTFTRADAGQVEPEGTVFFLYAPFGPETVARVMEKLRGLAERQPVTVCTVALQLFQVKWLTRRETSCPTLSIYKSRP